MDFCRFRRQTTTTDGQNNEYIVSIIENFSKFLELYAGKDLTANAFACCRLDFIGRYEVPKIYL